MIGANASAITVTWRVTPKHQPAHTTFKVPAIDAPNVNGARMLGLVEGEGPAGGGRENEEAADVSRLRSAVDEGRVPALYVFDPGPDGSIGDTQWIVNARTSGKVGLLIVQGVLMTDLARAADFVLPGASYVEKEASYTNDRGRLQGTARAIPAPGDAMEDWQILVNVSAALGVPFGYQTTAHVRDAIRPGARGNHDPGVQPSGAGSPLAGGLESVGALEVGLHVPGSAAGQGRGRSVGAARAAGDDSLERGEVAQASVLRASCDSVWRSSR